MSLSQFSQGVQIKVAATTAGIPLLRVTADDTGQLPAVLPLVNVLNSSTVIQQPDTAIKTNSGALSIDSTNGVKINYTTNAGASSSFVQVAPTGDINITVPKIGGVPGRSIVFNGDTADFTNVTNVVGVTAASNNIKEYIVTVSGANLPTSVADGPPVNVGGINAVNGAFMISVSGAVINVTGQPNYLPSSIVFMCVKQNGHPAIINSVANHDGQFGEHWDMVWGINNQITIHLTKLSGANSLTGATYTANISILHFSSITLS